MKELGEPNVRGQIRRAALVSSTAIGVCTLAFGLYYGRPPRDLAFASLGAAACSLAAWWAYHVASRRNDGLALTGAGLAPFARDRAWDFGIVLFVVAAVASITAIVGLLMRTTPPKSDPDPEL